MTNKTIAFFSVVHMAWGDSRTPKMIGELAACAVDKGAHVERVDSMSCYVEDRDANDSTRTRKHTELSVCYWL